MVTFYCKTCDATVTVPESAAICPFCLEETVPDLYVNKSNSGEIKNRIGSGAISNDRIGDIR